MGYKKSPISKFSKGAAPLGLIPLGLVGIGLPLAFLLKKRPFSRRSRGGIHMGAPLAASSIPVRILLRLSSNW